MNNEDAAEDGDEANNTNADDADGDDEGDGSDNDADNELDSDYMADPGDAAAAGGGAGRTKPIMPTFAGEGNNIFEYPRTRIHWFPRILPTCSYHTGQEARQPRPLSHRSGQEVVLDGDQIRGRFHRLVYHSSLRLGRALVSIFVFPCKIYGWQSVCGH